MASIKDSIRSRLFSGDVKRMIAADKIPDAERSLRRLRDLGFKPGLIFDIGAYHGDFTALCLDIWPEAEVHAFEALPEKIDGLKKRFKDARVRIAEGIVGEKETEGIEYYADETASSVLSSEEVGTKKKLIRQKMHTLAGYIADQGLRAPNFLKIDTQGYEYPILLGAGDRLAEIDAVLLEVNFLEVYEGVHLAHEVIALMASKGFVMYDICEIHRRPLDLALFQIDFLFVKKDSFLRKEKKWG